MIGYAADEENRLHRLTEKKQSILVQQGITEKQTFAICKEYGLLSPLYDLGINRDGCWFCPNSTLKERNLIRQYEYQAEQIQYLISLTPNAIECRYRNNWMKEWQEQQENEQMELNL